MSSTARTQELESLDLVSLARAYEIECLSTLCVLEYVLKRINSYEGNPVWIERLPDERVLDQARRIEERKAGGEQMPLFGVPFAVKDNIDVAGMPTTAGCPDYAYTPEATAPVVSRLMHAGAILVGKTNMDQFASGLCGDRSPYGACHSACSPEHISGGSSSGSAVAVAAGLVSFALGTDTAGSGRVPAGCNNIVGLKPTSGMLETGGIVPACHSLDCVSVFALTAWDAWKVLCAGRETRNSRPAGPPVTSFAVPREQDLEFCGDSSQAELYRHAIDQLEAMGLERHEIDFGPFREVGSLLYEGAWLAERFSPLEEFFDRQPDSVHPVTRSVIEGGRDVRGTDVFRCWHRLQELKGECLALFERADVFVVPTMPTLPKVADVIADSQAWSRRMGCYTNFVNLLGLSALAMPSGFTSDGMPGGITLIGPSGRDEMLSALGTRWQQQMNLPLGATQQQPVAPGSEFWDAAPSSAPTGYVRVSVAGAHLQHQPLHGDLLKFGARFVRACKTAPLYRFFGFTDLVPPRPGLLRDEERGEAISVEVYDLPFEGFGKLVASVSPPLATGTVELEGGEAVKGFLCESWHARTAWDITQFGGWVSFQSQAGDPNSKDHDPN